MESFYIHRICNIFLVWILAVLTRIKGEIHFQIAPHQGTHVRAGTDAKFTCSAITDFGTTSKPSISWKRNDGAIKYPLHSRYKISHEESTLTITNTEVEDTGVISCIASLGDYKAVASTQIVVQDVPDAPVNVKLESCHSRLAMISWQLLNENNSPVQYFIIQYNTSFKPKTWHIAKTAVPRDRYIERIALSPWGNYNFRVIARNSIGEGPPSDPTETSCQAPPDVPHHNPRQVCTANEKARQLIVTWQAMTLLEHNGPGFHYLVRWKRYDVPESVEFKQQTVSADENRLVVRDQPVYRPYEVYVLAVNSIGEAVTSPKIVIGYSGEDVPLDAPYHFMLDSDYYVTNTTAHFMWEPVKTTVSRVRGFFRGYRIEFWKTENPSQRKVHDIILDEPDLCKGIQTPDRKRRKVGHGQVRNLWPYTNISAHIRVLNMKYTGPPSNRVNFQTKEGVPDFVRLFRVIERGSTHLLLHWRRPNITNGILIGYFITYKAIKDTETYNEVWSIENPHQSKLKLYNLHPGQAYQLTICGRTKVGCGKGYSLETATLPASAPLAPDFSAVSVNKTKLNITWFTSAEGDPGCKFSVSYKQLGNRRWTETDDVMNRNWTLIGGLRLGTIYEVRVIAKNSGKGKFYQQTTSPVKQIQIGEKIKIIPPLFKVTTMGVGQLGVSLISTDKLSRAFYVQYKEAGSRQWSATDDVEIGDPVLLRNLIPGVMYELRVVTRSALGQATSIVKYHVAGTETEMQSSISGSEMTSRSSLGLFLHSYLRFLWIVFVLL